MIFLSSQNLIQSEAVLRPRHALPETKNKTGGGAATRRQNGKAASAKAIGTAPANGSSAPSRADGSAQPSNGDDAKAEIDFTQLPCGYHTAVVAGLALIRARRSSAAGVVTLTATISSCKQSIQRGSHAADVAGLCIDL